MVSLKRKPVIAILALILALSLLPQSLFADVTPVRAIPAAPSNLTAVKVNSSRIDLSWTDNSSDETGFHIETAVNQSFTNSVLFTITGANVTTYIDNTVYAGDTFYYRISSFNASGDSAFSNVVSVTISLPQPSLPTAPSNLVASAISLTQINLSWTDNSANETGFLLERAGDSVFSVGLESYTANANTVQYQDTGVTAGTTYYYRVKAYNVFGNSEASNVASISTSTVPILTLTPASGIPGMGIALAGRHFTANTSGTIWFDSDGDGSFDAVETRVTLTTDAAGNIPSVSNLAVPAVAPGNYQVRADIPDEGSIEASSVFNITPASLTLNPASGAPVGGITAITVSGNGFAVNTTGTVWFDANRNGLCEQAESKVNVTTSASGAVSSIAINTLTVPSGVYNVLADIPAGGPIEASASFAVTPGVAVSPTTGTAGTTISLSGGGFAANSAGIVWFDTNGNSSIDTREVQSPVTTTPEGSIPTGCAITAPSLAAGSYAIRADIPAGVPVEASTGFTAIARALISGETRDVNGTILTDLTVIIDSATPVVSSAQGVYQLAAIATGTHTLIASKTGYRNQTRTINVASLTDTYTLDFKGDNALVPNSVNLTYVLGCINKWKFPPEGLGLSLTKVLAVINAWKFPIT